MTDRELLENAAKAAGIVGEYESWTYQGFNEGIRQVLNGIKCWKPWNPLTDDGDALRLAVKLEMCIDFMDRRVIAGASGPEVVIDFEDNDYRRAVVRAAAEIGRNT